MRNLSLITTKLMNPSCILDVSSCYHTGYVKYKSRNELEFNLLHNCNREQVAKKHHLP